VGAVVDNVVEEGVVISFVEAVVVVGAQNWEDTVSVAGEVVSKVELLAW